MGKNFENRCKIMSISITAGHIIAKVKNTPLEELSEFFLEAKGDALYLRKDLIARLNERILEETGKELTKLEIHLLDKFYQTSTVNIPLLQVLDILRNDISELPIGMQNLANYCVNDKYEWKFLSFDELKKFSKIQKSLTGNEAVKPELTPMNKICKNCSENLDEELTREKELKSDS